MTKFRVQVYLNCRFSAKKVGQWGEVPEMRCTYVHAALKVNFMLVNMGSRDDAVKTLGSRLRRRRACPGGSTALSERPCSSTMLINACAEGCLCPVVGITVCTIKRHGPFGRHHSSRSPDIHYILWGCYYR